MTIEEMKELLRKYCKEIKESRDKLLKIGVVTPLEQCKGNALAELGKIFDEIVTE